MNDWQKIVTSGQRARSRPMSRIERMFHVMVTQLRDIERHESEETRVMARLMGEPMTFCEQWRSENR